jgi:hypothetical protein
MSREMGHLWDKWDVTGTPRAKSGPSEAQVGQEHRPSHATQSSLAGKGAPEK